MSAKVTPKSVPITVIAVPPSTGPVGGDVSHAYSAEPPLSRGGMPGSIESHLINERLF